MPRPGIKPKQIIWSAVLSPAGNVGPQWWVTLKTYQTKQGKVRHHYYECNRRDRERNCTNPQIKKNLVDDYVLAELQRKLFNKDSIPALVKKINEYKIKQESKNQDELSKLHKSLDEVTTQLTNLVNVLAMGVGQQIETIVSKMKDLESNKTLLQNRIRELDKKIKAALITQDMVESYLEQHRQHIENKDIDACKKFISNYVEQVTVYKDVIEVKILLDIDGGGGAYRSISRMIKTDKILQIISLSGKF